MKTRLILSIFALLVFMSSARSESYHFEYQKSIDISGKTELVISNISGAIVISGASADEITIDAVKHIRAVDLDEAENIANHIEIRVNKNGSKLSIETSYNKLAGKSKSFWKRLLGTGSDSYGAVDFNIAVPHDCKIEVENGTGDVTINDITNDIEISCASSDLKINTVNGSVDIRTNSGSVELTDIIGNVDVAATSSDIVLESIQGGVSIRATSGKTEGNYISGPVEISKTSGDVDLKNLKGDLQISLTSGEINLEQESGTLELYTSSGDVTTRTTLDSSDDYYIETASGRIFFYIPETSSGTMRLESMSGNINTELPLAIKQLSKRKLIGDFGHEGPRVSLITESGDITLGRF